MDELRFARRDDQALIITSDTGEEFRLVVDDALLSELRHLSRRGRGDSRVKPREIQALIRAGKTRDEVAEITGLESEDIERYEEPVLAERRYILERAHRIPVRTDRGEEEQEFGSVIAERLVGIGAGKIDWSSWRDEEAGWMVGLDFSSHDIDHKAVWAFDHRKNVLSPLNSDAVNLSKQGDVGDRLIPKLRAVDADDSERFDSDAFDSDQLAPAADHPASGAPVEGEASGAPAETQPPVEEDQEAEYARRRSIDERAISTTPGDSGDMGQTADLLDALRRRRGERERLAAESDTVDTPRTESASSEDAPSEDAQQEDPNPVRPPEDTPLHLPIPEEPATDTPVKKSSPSFPLDFSRPARSRQTSSSPAVSSAAPSARHSDSSGSTEPASETAKTSAEETAERPSREASSRKTNSDSSGTRRRRASIPSWDDILFGTRSDDDPA